MLNIEIPSSPPVIIELPISSIYSILEYPYILRIYCSDNEFLNEIYGVFFVLNSYTTIKS
jgi:hypothetical protein